MSEHSQQAAVMPEGNSYDGSAEAHAQQDAVTVVERSLHNEQSSNEEQVVENTEAQAQPEQNEEKDNFSSKFAALSKREKAIREKESALEQKIAELEARMSQMGSQQQPEPTQVEKSSEPEMPLEYRLKRNPLQTLEELGLNFETLTNLALNDGNLTPEMKMELMKQDLDSKYSKELEDIKNQLMEKEKAEEERKHQEVIDNFKYQLTNFINSNENYELIRANEASDLVFDVIREHWEATGRVMSNEDAADQVEAYLEEEAERFFKSTKKLQSRFGSAPEPQKQEVKSSPTLSNNLSSTHTETKRKLTKDESIAAAASLLRWND